jgi:ATP-binding cassette subfamily C protein LapB
MITAQRNAITAPRPKGLFRDPFAQNADRLHDHLRRTVWRDWPPNNPWTAALCGLALALEPDCTAQRLADAIPHGLQRIDTDAVLETMANLGYRGTSMTAEPGHFDLRLCPALFMPFQRPGRPCVLLRDGRMYDAATMRVTALPKRPGSGEALVFARCTDEQDPTSKLARTVTGLPWFRTLFLRFKPLFARVLAVGLILNLIALSTPLFIMVVYDRVISAHNPSILPVLAGGAAASVLMEAVLRMLRSRQLSWLSSRLDHIVSNRLFSQLVHMPPSVIEGAPVQAQIARLKTYESVRDFFSSPMFLSMIELPFTLLALIAMAVIAGKLALVPLAGMACYAVLFWAIWRKVRVTIKIAAKAGSARQRYVLDTLTRLEDIRASGLPDIWREKYREVSGREAAAQFDLNWIGLVGETAANAITVLSAVTIVGFGAGMVWSGAISTGALVASMILVWRVLNPFYSLCTMVPRLDQMRNSIRQINQLMDLDTEEQASRTLAKPQALQGQVTFSNVGMRYGHDDPVFTNLSFQIQPGQIAAVTGENGSGKSTLLKLAKGLYHAPAGSVRLDGFDVRQLDPLSLRRKIAYIAQNPSFFTATVAENLRFANPSASRDDIEAALDRADALEDIVGLPDGLNTAIGGDMGVQLSSSLAMRLSLARSYLHDSRVLLVDEMPNSLMTGPAGRNLIETLMREKGRRTVLLVTYHVDMLRVADQIVWLRPGEPPLAGERNLMLRHLKQGNW